MIQTQWYRQDTVQVHYILQTAFPLSSGKVKKCVIQRVDSSLIPRPSHPSICHLLTNVGEGLVILIMCNYNTWMLGEHVSLFLAGILLLISSRKRPTFGTSYGSDYQAGSPSSCVLHCIKRNAKSRYMYKVRCLKCCEQFIRRQKIAAALASSNSNSFWQQVHHVNKSKKPVPVSKAPL